jgi:hypothetical protein
LTGQRRFSFVGGLTLAASGVALGILGAVFLTPLMSAVLFAVRRLTRRPTPWCRWC